MLSDVLHGCEATSRILRKRYRWSFCEIKVLNGVFSRSEEAGRKDMTRSFILLIVTKYHGIENKENAMWGAYSKNMGKLNAYKHLILKLYLAEHLEDLGLDQSRAVN
jgi:hypothetical protein